MNTQGLFGTLPVVETGNTFVLWKEAGCRLTSHTDNWCQNDLPKSPNSSQPGALGQQRGEGGRRADGDSAGGRAAITATRISGIS